MINLQSNLQNRSDCQQKRIKLMKGNKSNLTYKQFMQHVNQTKKNGTPHSKNEKVSFCRESSNKMNSNYQQTLTLSKPDSEWLEFEQTSELNILKRNKNKSNFYDGTENNENRIDIFSQKSLDLSPCPNKSKKKQIKLKSFNCSSQNPSSTRVPLSARHRFEQFDSIFGENNVLASDDFNQMRKNSSQNDWGQETQNEEDDSQPKKILKLKFSKRKNDQNLQTFVTDHTDISEETIFQKGCSTERVFTNYDRQKPSFYEYGEQKCFQKSSCQLFDFKRPSDKICFTDRHPKALNHNKSVRNVHLQIRNKSPLSQRSKALSVSPINKHQNSKSPQNKSQKKTFKASAKSQEYIFNNFIGMVSEVLTRTIKINAVTEEEQRLKLLEHKISYIEYLEVLKELNMIKTDYQPYGNAGNRTDLVAELWQELIMGSTVNNFIMILAIILKAVENSNQSVRIEKAESNSNNSEVYRKLQEKYDTFRFTRLELTKSNKSVKAAQGFTFLGDSNLEYQRPSESSQKVARNGVKSRKKYKINTSVCHYDCENQENRSTSRVRSPHNLSRDTLRNHQKSFNQNNYENCSLNTEFDQTFCNANQSNKKMSFSPSKTKSVKTGDYHNSSLFSEAGNKRSEILYQMGKQQSLEKRYKQDKSTIDYEYQKNASQLTFQPNVSNNGMSTGGKKSAKIVGLANTQKFAKNTSKIEPQNIYGQQSSVNRMIKGRVMKAVKSEITQKGLPYNEKNISKITKKHYEILLKEQEKNLIRLNKSQEKRKSAKRSTSPQHSNKNNERKRTLIDEFTQEEENDVEVQSRLIQDRTSPHRKVEKCTPQNTKNEELQFFNLVEAYGGQNSHKNSVEGKAERSNMLVCSPNKKSETDSPDHPTNKNPSISDVSFQNRKSSSQKQNLSEPTLNDSNKDGNAFDNKGSLEYQRKVCSEIQTEGVCDQSQLEEDMNPDDYFILSIEIAEGKCEELLLHKSCTPQQVNEEAQSFVKRHDLPDRMEEQLKNELLIALKFHNLEKIDEDVEEEDDESSLFQNRASKAPSDAHELAAQRNSPTATQQLSNFCKEARSVSKRGSLEN